MAGRAVADNGSPQSQAVRFRSAVSGFLTGLLGREVPLVDVNTRGRSGSHLDIPGVATRVTAGRTGQSISVGLTEAQEAARQENKAIAVVIAQREHRTLEKSFAVLSLADFGILLTLALKKGLDHE